MPEPNDNLSEDFANAMESWRRKHQIREDDPLLRSCAAANHPEPCATMCPEAPWKNNRSSAEQCPDRNRMEDEEGLDNFVGSEAGATNRNPLSCDGSFITIEHTRHQSVKSERRRQREKGLPPFGLRRSWPGALLLLSHRALKSMFLRRAWPQANCGVTHVSMMPCHSTRARRCEWHRRC